MKKLNLLLLPIILLGCNKPKQEPSFIEYVSLCVYTQFLLDYEDREIILTYTQEINNYYISNIYYRIEFENDVYETKYISAVNDKNELVIKEIKK